MSYFVSPSNFPHNSVSIPALFLQIILFLFYLLSAVLLVILFASLIFFVAPIRDHVAYSVSLKPTSFTRHLDYFSLLLASRRLDEAKREHLFLSEPHSDFVVSRRSIRHYNFLASSLNEQNFFLHSVLMERDYWRSFLSSHPHYRDGLYRLAQLEYILKDTQASIFYLRQARQVDPRFVLADEVVHSLHVSDSYFN